MFSRRGDPILYISRDIVERFYLADEIGNVRCSIACALNNIGCWIFSPWRGSGTEIRVIDRPAFPLNLNNGGINLPSSRLINPQNLNSRPRQASDATDSFFTSSSFFFGERGATFMNNKSLSLALTPSMEQYIRPRLIVSFLRKQKCSLINHSSSL